MGRDPVELANRAKYQRLSDVSAKASAARNLGQ